MFAREVFCSWEAFGISKVGLNYVKVVIQGSDGFVAQSESIKNQPT